MVGAFNINAKKKNVCRVVVEHLRKIGNLVDLGTDERVI
jgi:hypothetical protein